MRREFWRVCDGLDESIVDKYSKEEAIKHLNYWKALYSTNDTFYITHFREVDPKYDEAVAKMEEAVKFYREPRSIEKFLVEVKIPGTNNTRPSIDMEFYRKGIEALAEFEKFK